MGDGLCGLSGLFVQLNVKQVSRNGSDPVPTLLQMILMVYLVKEEVWRMLLATKMWFVQVYIIDFGVNKLW